MLFVNTLFEKKVKKEIQTQKNDYWNKISQKLPIKSNTNELKSNNTSNQFYFRRIAPIALSGAVALFAFFVVSNFNKIMEPNIVKKQTVKLSELVKIRDSAIEESRQGKQNTNSDSNSANNQLQSRIKYISEK